MRGTIVVSWQDNSNNETGFKIYKSTDGVNFGAPIATVGAGVTTYTAIVVTGQQYWFRVTAYNGNGESSSYAQAGPISCYWEHKLLFKECRGFREF